MALKANLYATYRLIFGVKNTVKHVLSGIKRTPY